MTAFNTVRFKVKSGYDRQFIDAHKNAHRDWPGLRQINLIQTAEHNYCIIGEWDSMDTLANARSSMIQTLDTFRYTLEDLGGGLGVTDPVSGPVIWSLK